MPEWRPSTMVRVIPLDRFFVRWEELSTLRAPNKGVEVGMVGRSSGNWNCVSKMMSENIRAIGRT